VVTLINTGGNIVLNEAINVSKNAAGTNDGTIQLKASGDITDGANGNLVANTNGVVNAVSTGGKIVLDRNDAVATDGHSVAQVSLETSGTGGDRSIVFHDADALEVSTATATGALSTPGSVAATSVGSRAQGAKTVVGTSNGAVTLKAGGALTVSQAIATTPTAADTVGGTVTLEAAGGITTQTLGTITTTGSGNAAGGEVLLVNATSGDITLGKAILAQGGSSGTPGSSSDGGVVTLINTGGNIVLNEAINVSKNAAGTNDGTIQLKASGDITDGANGNLVANTNGVVNAVSTGGKIVLDRNDAVATDGHSVAQVSLETSGTGGDRSIVFHDADALEVSTATATGALSTPGSVAATSVGSRAQGAKTVVGTSNGAVTLKAGGALTVSQAIATTPTAADTVGGTVTLEAAGG